MRRSVVALLVSTTFLLASTLCVLCVLYYIVMPHLQKQAHLHTVCIVTAIQDYTVSSHNQIPNNVSVHNQKQIANADIQHDMVPSHNHTTSNVSADNLKEIANTDIQHDIMPPHNHTANNVPDDVQTLSFPSSSGCVRASVQYEDLAGNMKHGILKVEANSHLPKQVTHEF